MNHDAPHYTKVASHEAVNGEFDTCLLLYSGGLDTSVMLKWLQEKYNCKVITLTVNIGQTVDDLDAIAEKAKTLGAIETITVDARDRFADELLSLAIKANADYQGGYALCTPLGRIIISQLAVEYAEKYDCRVIAHGATGKGNDQVRFETYITTRQAAVHWVFLYFSESQLTGRHLAVKRQGNTKTSGATERILVDGGDAVC
jgi:argininosuccinate synthase